MATTAAPNSNPIVPQSSGEYREYAIYSLDDGRIVQKRISEQSQTEWTTKMNSLISIVDEDIAHLDSENNIDDAEVKSSGTASIQEVAVAYLQKAWKQEDPYSALILFNRFNDYRNSQGWSLNQVYTNLSSAGLLQSEWDDMLVGFPALLANSDELSAVDTINRQWRNR